MKTEHFMLHSDATDMSQLKDASIALVVTSPPYPMIEMWDDCFCEQSEEVESGLRRQNGMAAFEAMHTLLDQVWREVDRVLVPGGIACVNIGDATRTMNGVFQLYSNHARIVCAFQRMGYCVLPDIIWRKPSNAPNKFMGSGMYPGGAYVTYEHEYILIFRKGGKRLFHDNKLLRQHSAYFWEERNVWFSDLWEIRGAKQTVQDGESSKRSAAFPFEIPYRLINMYSVLGDTVLDPFAGTGTTLLAAMAAGRNSIGIDINTSCVDIAVGSVQKEPQLLNQHTGSRLLGHRRFIEALPEEQRRKCYQSENYPFLVKTRQEVKAVFPLISEISRTENGVECRYRLPQGGPFPPTGSVPL